MHPDNLAPAEFSARQREVLTAVLDLMVETGDNFSMATVARRARCSKETLYKWFGDRDGLLTATVQWQASKVRMPDLPRAGLTREKYAAGLRTFAFNWLSVITGDVSIALNRLAISHAGSQKGGLGQIVLHNGPFAMARRLEPIFMLGRAARVIAFDDVYSVFHAYFGLVVSEVQIRCLLGDEQRPSPDEINFMADRAVEQFLALFGVREIRQAGRKSDSNQG
jgi:AcrR family transcriptional regulator